MRSFGPARGFQRGLSLLEVVIVVILFSLLFLLALDRFLPLRGQAESAKLIYNEGVMREALGQEVAHRVMKQGLASLSALEGSNPVDLLATPPPDYLGARTSVSAAQLRPGSWAFDESRGVLVYRVLYPMYFDGKPDDPPRVEWRIELFHTPGAPKTPENLRGVLLVPLGKAHWRLDNAVL